MTDWPPRVLSNLYRNGLQTFYELLLDLITKSLHSSEETNGSGAAELREQVGERLIGDGDPPEYCILLKNSYSVMPETAPCLGHVSFEQRWTQEQIVDRVIVLQFQQEDKPSHVLCGGYQKLRPSVRQSGQRRSPPGLDCVCENSAVDTVTSPSWKILLSRVGDLIMLHVLTHAAVFFPLPNNCFLQVSGGPTSSVVSMAGKSLTVHPGEKMLGAGVRKTSMAKSCTRQHSQTGRSLHSNLVKDEEKQAARNVGVVRNQTSNFTLSPHLKRRRPESAETGMEIDALDVHSKYYDPSKCKIGSKRKRRGSGDKIRQSGEIVRPDKDASEDITIQSGSNSPHDLPAASSQSNPRNFCSRRAPEGTTVKHSVQHNSATVDDDENLQSRNPKKKQKLIGKIEQDKYSQEENKLIKIPGQVSAGFQAMAPPLLQRGKTTEKKTEFCRQLEGRNLENDTASTYLPNRFRRDSSVGHDTFASSSNVEGTSNSKKRVRLPSWKRRKLRQAQEFCLKSVHKDPPLESCGKAEVTISQLQMPAAKVEEVLRKTGKEDSYLHASGSHPLQAFDKAASGCCLPSAEGIGGTNFGHRVPKNTPQRKKFPYGMGTTDSEPERIVDRAPIFYNANYSCHPGLPAKHILNTSKPDEAGVAHLFSAIFGGHICAINSPSKLKPGRGSQCKPVHKLLQELLSNARRCRFDRLLNRHCPLPEGFYNDAPKAKTLRTERAGGELGKAMQDTKEESACPDPAPEVQKIMSLLLGQNYQPVERTTAAHSERNSTNPSDIVPERREFSSIALQTSMCSVGMSEQVKQDNALETSVDDNLANEKNKQAEFISCYTTHSKVVGFLWAVCRSIIPHQMLGCLRSWRSLCGSIAHFVGLRRHEKFNVKHALFKLLLSSFSWLAFQGKEDSDTAELPSGRVTVEESALKQRRLESWFYWLFTGLLVPLIRAHFYVTENENHRQNIFYYRKPVWARIRSSGMRELTSKNYKKLGKQAVAQMLNSRVLGFSKIRLLPKQTGLRPIANLAASSQGTLKFSMLSKGKATLCQVFGNISKDLSLDDCSKLESRVWSLPDQRGSPIVSNFPQCTALVPYEASASMDAERFSVGEKESSGDWCLNNSSAATNGSLSSAGASKTRGSFVFVKSPNNQKRNKKSVRFSFRSINSVLRDAYCCLKLEQEAHPEDLGSSVFGYCDVHRKVLPFIMQLKESPNGMPRLFMAVCDMTKAYDNIPQAKMLEIVESFVHSSNYNVAKYKCITPTLGSVRVSHGRTCALADEPKKFVDSVRGLATKRSHCIFVDQASSASLRREHLLAMLREHVKENIVQIGSHFYQQKVGIPQGSILSSLLCSLLYGHHDVHGLLPAVQSRSTETANDSLDTISAARARKERIGEGGPCLTSSIASAAGFHECDDIEKLLEFSLEGSDTGQDDNVETKPNVCNEDNPEIDLSELQGNSLASGCEETGTSGRDSVLLRLIDDSLFISTSESGAKLFVESMHRGSKEYGCQANERKTASSFCLQLGNQVLPAKVYKTEDGACFMRWSGLLVNCFTLEFQADYTRYCGEHIRSALTVRREKNQGWHLVLKMCQYMRPKCHALFFDPRINSPATIRLNAFQAFLLCAMKFHAYVCCLPRVTETNEPFLYKAFDCAIRYMYGLLRHKMRSVGAEAQAYFPYNELEWLALVAFHRVLKRKQARYPILLDMLRRKLQMPKYAQFIARPHLSSATDERRSSMFKFIKY